MLIVGSNHHLLVLVEVTSIGGIGVPYYFKPIYAVLLIVLQVEGELFRKVDVTFIIRRVVLLLSP